MANKSDQRRRQMARLAFQRLSEGKPLLRREIFADPSTGQHLLELWETKFLKYLEDKGIINRPGTRTGGNTRYQVVMSPKPEALKVLELLLSEDRALGFLLFTNKDPAEVYAMENGNGVVHNDNGVDDHEEPPDEEPEPPAEVTEGGLLELIADRLTLVLKALVYMRESLDEAKAREVRLEQKMDLIIKELGAKMPEETG